MSPPAENAVPAPVITTAQTAGSTAASSSRSASIAIASTVSAFSASGLLRVSVTTPSDRSTSTTSLMDPSLAPVTADCQSIDHRTARHSRIGAPTIPGLAGTGKGGSSRPHAEIRASNLIHSDVAMKGLRLPILGQPSPNEPKDVHLVGRYALGVTWVDGHSSIYPFDRLRLDDPAASRDAGAVLTEEMGWPQDIKRLPEGLRVTWTDGHQSLYPYADLRALCRCAGCTGGH